MAKTIVITGASTGIGRAAADHFARQGWQTAATMRKPEDGEGLRKHANLRVYRLDVRESESIEETKEQVLRDFNEVDVVLNNAGYGLAGAFEAATSEQIRRQFDTNLFGLMNVTSAFLPHFRKRKTGMFINISSIGGLMTFPCMSLYHTTKWAVEGFSEALSYEVGRFGIQVKIVEPGAVRTDFGSRSLDFARKDGLDDYDAVQGQVMNWFQERMGEDQGSSAEDIARIIYEAASDGKKRMRYLAGNDAEATYQRRMEIGSEKFVSEMDAMVFGG